MPVVAGTQYATRTDLGNLGLIGGALSNIPTATQDAALAAASALADSYLQSRYDLPLVNWGQDLAAAVCSIAAYNIMTARGYNPAAGTDENIRLRYLDAIKWLDEVGKGTQTPSYVIDSSVGGGGASPGAASADDSAVTTTEGGIQIVTQSVRGWTDRGTTTGGAWDNGWSR